MAEAAVNLAFLGATTYLVGRDIYGYLPSLPTTSSSTQKRLRGEPAATVSMDDETCDPATLPPRASRGPPLAPGLRKAVKACCETLLEAKYCQDRVTGTVPVATGVARVTCLNDLGQGNTAETRVGNKILMKELSLEGTIYLPPTLDADIYRLIVVLDHECYGSACTFAQYTQGTVSQQIYSLPSMETVGKSKRFTVLADKQIVLNRADPPGASSSSVLHTISVKIPLNCSAQYSGNAGTISDLVRNSLCVIEVSSAGRCGADWNSRLVYLDG